MQENEENSGLSSELCKCCSLGFIDAFEDKDFRYYNCARGYITKMPLRQKCEGCTCEGVVKPFCDKPVPTVE
jgi:hypothetical protein